MTMITNDEGDDDENTDDDLCFANTGSSLLELQSARAGRTSTYVVCMVNLLARASPARLGDVESQLQH